MVGAAGRGGGVTGLEQHSGGDGTDKRGPRVSGGATRLERHGGGDGTDKWGPHVSN
jgi:hypothetical protein